MKVDSRIIMKKTGCTREQAKYLAEEIRNLPKVKDIIMEHIEEVNLFGCEKVEVIRMCGYMDDSVKIAGYRLDKSKSFTFKGEAHNFYRTYLWTFDKLFPEIRFFETR